MKTAILQVADTGPLESLVVWLESVGYQCCTPDDKLKRTLRDLGCDTVLDIDGLVNGMGYARPLELPLAGIPDMSRTGILYVDVKAHRNGPKVWKRWPNLEKRTLWYRINGGEPEHVVNARGDHGDERNPPCPVLTPNLWYREEGPWKERSYAAWPPFYRWGEYRTEEGRELWLRSGSFAPPLCLIHNLGGWGYGALIEPMRNLGVRMYGAGSPAGLIDHAEVQLRLQSAVAMVHLKSSDAPGYALYEALASGCPVLVTRRLIWRNRMEELLEPGKTCLVFDRIGHQELSEADVVDCENEVKEALERLRDPEENRRIGFAGRDRLRSVMWSADREEDTRSLREFMGRRFG